MKIIDSGSTLNCEKSIVTMGAFDGIHLGHRSILEEVVTEGQRLGLSPTLFTLWPHPKKILNPTSKLELLNSFEEKIELLKSIGIEQIYVQDFTYEFSQLSAHEFIEKTLVKRLNANRIIIGYDHKFGRNRAGDTTLLHSLSLDFGFSVAEIKEQQILNNTISSTNIRSYLRSGDIISANKMLGYQYSLDGIVIRGDQIGRSIGFPTANLEITEPHKLLPKHGVYVVDVKVNNNKYRGMLNLGYRPTVSGESLRLEVHILNFNQDIYGTSIRVNLLDRLRDETKFDSISELKTQLCSDKKQALNYLT